MSRTLVLHDHDGLHYCPTNVYAVDIDTMPASRFSPAVRRVAFPATLSVPGKSRSHELSMTGAGGGMTMSGGGGEPQGWVCLFALYLYLTLSRRS